MTRRIDQLLESALKNEETRYKAIQDALQRNAKIRRAIAMQYPKATIIGVATASKRTTTQQELFIDLLPFNVVNGNRQAVDISEKQNLLETAIAQPITANFDGFRLFGHKDTKPYGTITEVIDNGDRLSAKAVLWITDESQDLIDYIAEKKTVGSSFELLYGREEHKNGAVWIYDTVFYAQALVSMPAYPEAQARLAT